MGKKYLPDLIAELDLELLRRGYTKGSMTFYRRRWNQLMAYADYTESVITSTRSHIMQTQKKNNLEKEQ